MRTKNSINKSVKYMVKQYSDLQKTDVIFSSEFKTRDEIAKHLGCNAQTITDFFRGVTGKSQRKFSVMSYVDITKLEQKTFEAGVGIVLPPPVTQTGTEAEEPPVQEQTSSTLTLLQPE